jgi:hypothetical protein
MVEKSSIRKGVEYIRDKVLKSKELKKVIKCYFKINLTSISFQHGFMKNS